MPVILLTGKGTVSTASDVYPKTNGGTEQVSVAPDVPAATGKVPQTLMNLIRKWGRARTGSSYITSFLARREKEDVLPIQGEFKACTVGEVISEAIFGLVLFSRSSDAAGEEQLGEGSTL